LAQSFGATDASPLKPRRYGDCNAPHQGAGRSRRRFRVRWPHQIADRFATVIRSSDMTALIVILTIAAASRLKAIPI
jgi:hypothetical protein